MNFQVKEAIEILERTPQTLDSLLSGISESWLVSNEGKGTWNILQVIDHLIEADITNWIPRLELMVQRGGSEVFPPFDRFAHLKNDPDASLVHRLHEYKKIRVNNLAKLNEMITSDKVLEYMGEHPDFGEVRVRELLSTWVVHDLTHVSQIVRILAERYRQDVGPWADYLGILK
ncbi:DinB family protein [Bacillus salacetis]|uniref:DinB family protein n=1 Tax=Bacillus salacetis TaxID=2315464 RepID=A0A3A1R3Q6_9BACI|nr:DinB family protein [Bacillus salacetis]RIW33615.1 DinB family protein [Bacillus salacetis]